MTEKPQSNTRWLRWLLVGSLALNLAFIGLIAGAALRGGPPERVRPQAPDMLRELVRAVPKNQRDALRADLAAKKDEMNVLRTQTRKTRGNLVRVLEDTDFDISQVVAIFEEHRVILSRMTQGGHEIIIRRIESMSDADRVVFAQNIQKFQAKRQSRK